jgi:uncharacterized GH25 family protein
VSAVSVHPLFHRFSLFALFAILCAMTVPVLAHDTWLQPRRTAVLPGTIAQVDLAGGEKFAAHGTAIKPERIQSARFRLNGQVREIADRTPEKKSLELRAPLSDAGVAVLWVSLAPQPIELKPQQVKHYLDEIDAPAALRRLWEAGKTKQWREIYTKHAKVFIRVGRPKADRSWGEPVGLALEIVPEKDPTLLSAGDDFSVRVLKNGVAFADFSLGIVREGGTNREFRKTDSAGRVVFRVPRSGKWLLRGTDLRTSTKPPANYESDFTTLMFEVK